MACDSQDTTDEIIRFCGCKLRELDDGRYIGGCGEYGHFARFCEFLNGECERSDILDGFYDETIASAMLLYDPIDGKAYLAQSYEFELYEVPLPTAIGSGAPFAIGALAMGASAEEAVEVASKSDPSTGGDIHIWDLPIP